MHTFSPPPPPALPPADISWPSAERQASFQQWLASAVQAHGVQPHTLQPASADASFRRYFRVQTNNGPLIVMDAPPPQEDVRPFVDVAALALQAGLHVPQVLQADLDRGFLLLTDLGSTPYLQALQAGAPGDADTLMRDALSALMRWQTGVPAAALPPFDADLLQRELDLFPTWCVEREFGIVWTDKQRATWQRICGLLVASAVEQPQVAVHADWMPRNLMVGSTPASNPGVLDFQDAVRGPITYDLASLLRDAFISWDEPQELDWAVRWWQMARRAGLPLGETMESDFGEVWRALEWMGLQRHLKVMGIFCRLKHRDGKPHYAADLPRFLAYGQKVALRYGPLKPLLTLLEPLSGAKVGAGFTF